MRTLLCGRAGTVCRVTCHEMHCAVDGVSADAAHPRVLSPCSPGSVGQFSNVLRPGMTQLWITFLRYSHCPVKLLLFDTDLT